MNDTNCQLLRTQSAQSFSRKIIPSQRALVGRSDGGFWRFFVKSDKMTLIEIEQTSTLNSFPPKRIYIAPNSAQEFQGSEPCQIFATNLDGSENALVETWDAQYLEGGLNPVIYSEDVLTTAASAAFGAIGTNGGYPQPYTNKLRLYVSASFRLRAVALSGDVVLNSGTQPVDESLIYELNCPQNLKWEIREDSSSAGGIKYSAVWFRE